jgi:hypothetical protein
MNRLKISKNAGYPAFGSLCMKAAYMGCQKEGENLWQRK